MLFTILGWALFGLVVGAIARFLVPGQQSMGWLATIGLGVVGSFVGGFLGSLIFGGEVNLQNPAGWIGGIIGAVIVLLIYIQFTKRNTA